MVGWIEMKLGTEVGLGVGPGHSSPKKFFPQKVRGTAAPPNFVAHLCCGQTAGWIKMPLGMAVNLGPGRIVLDGDPAPHPERGTAASPLFGPCPLWPNGRPSQLLYMLNTYITSGWMTADFVWRHSTEMTTDCPYI